MTSILKLTKLSNYSNNNNKKKYRKSGHIRPTLMISTCIT